MTILITAVTGIVGSYLAEFLAASNTTDICGTYLEKPAQVTNPKCSFAPAMLPMGRSKIFEKATS